MRGSTRAIDETGLVSEIFIVGAGGFSFFWSKEAVVIDQLVLLLNVLSSGYLLLSKTAAKPCKSLLFCKYLVTSYLRLCEPLSIHYLLFLTSAADDFLRHCRTCHVGFNYIVCASALCRRTIYSAVRRFLFAVAKPEAKQDRLRARRADL